jgi:choline dehydrogenase-like flavoprotein
MLIDARQVPRDTEVVTDVCIIGAGAAGITLAREFAGRPFKVCLLESGGLDFDSATQDLYAGEIDGFPEALDVSRLRYFGGSTNHWTGASSFLEPIVMQKRPWVPHSGWPISRADLDPFYGRAAEITQIGTHLFNPEYWRDDMAAFFKQPPFADGRLVAAIWRKSPPTRFAKTYRADLEAGENIAIYLNANVVDIETDETARRVSGLRVACLDGNRFRVTGKLFILAAGGVENPRLLLASNSVQTAGLGNANDLVGRFFADHVGFTVAQILLNEPSDSAISPLSAVGVVTTRLMLSDATVEQEKLTQFAALVEPVHEGDGYGTGYLTLRRLTKMVRHGQMPDHLWGDLYNILADLGGLIEDLGEKFGAVSALNLISATETIPNPDNRVTLIEERDALGMHRVRLHWRFSADDKQILRRTVEIIGEEMGRAGVGRLKAHDWLLTEDLDGHAFEAHHHHMCTTRMSDDPKTGVVDPDCRVHGMDNLYIAGSSVFTNTGVASPTISIVALALRLADHIKARLA